MSMLELRKKIKARKPAFIRQDNPKRMKVNGKWRMPKGVHSKIRHKFKGRRKMPSPGYKSPVSVRGLHALGMGMVSVSNTKDLEKLNPKTQGVVVSKNVGMKKKLEILKTAKHMKLSVLNINADDHISKIEQVITSKKKPQKKSKEPKVAKETKEEKKETAHEYKDHSHIHKEEEGKDASDEEKKKAEKKEKDKILMQKV